MGEVGPCGQGSTPDKWYAPRTVTLVARQTDVGRASPRIAELGPWALVIRAVRARKRRSVAIVEVREAVAMIGLVDGLSRRVHGRPRSIPCARRVGVVRWRARLFGEFVVARGRGSERARSQGPHVAVVAEVGEFVAIVG
jgi:hypothetical protein